MEYTTTMYGRLGIVRERGGVQHAGWPGGAFETRDGKWLVFTAPAQHLFDRMCAMIGQPDLPKDPRFATAAERPKHIPWMIDVMTAWFRERSFAEAIEALTKADIPHSPIMSMADIFADAHYRARDMIIDVPVPGLGAFPQPGVIPKLSRTPGRVTHAGLAMGSHTDEILKALLGYDEPTIAALRAEKVI
jgi:crotonobetainyl-CoA:carnitine CoA-transferase CaiB-like acyl-CoA transferase